MISLKSEIGTLVENAYPDPGALRLEARMRYVARLIDATDSALSKHDQVVVSSTTRLGRIRASIPVCMACDRPLRNKARKGKVMEVNDRKMNGSRMQQGKEQYIYIYVPVHLEEV